MPKTKLQTRLERFSDDESAPATTRVLAKIIAGMLGRGDGVEDISHRMGCTPTYLYNISGQGSEMLLSTLARNCKSFGYSVCMTVTRDSDGKSWEYRCDDDEL